MNNTENTEQAKLESNENTGIVETRLHEQSVAEIEQPATQSEDDRRPADPIHEVMDNPPATLVRPMQVIDNHAYAMVKVYLKTTVKEGLSKENKVVQHDPPLEKINHVLRVVRDDAEMFGEGTNNPQTRLGFNIRYPDFVPTNKLLPSQAIRDLENKNIPDPIEVFEKLARNVDRFFDFNRSLADQKTMCELIAASILTTWFIDAFNVAGYVWITGGKGSGKTQLLNFIAELAYLGQVILASSTLATLRDMSGVGAFLGFDDAENYSSAGKSDPDKRALMLAGNRRGSTITVKEATPDGTWKHRFVSTFSPKGFTATSKPESILSSRAIVIPMVRTSNRRKVNADPLDENLWLDPPQQLRSELWKTALTNLVRMRHFDGEAASSAALAGRNLEAWRGVLAVALWLDSLDKRDKLRRTDYGNPEEQGGSLFARLNGLSLKYQSMRSEFETNDYTRLVLRAIFNCVAQGKGEILDEVVDARQLQSLQLEFHLSTEQIAAKARQIVEFEGLDFEVNWIENRRIGRVVSQLRFEQKRIGGIGKAGWLIKRKDLEDLLDSYSLLKREEDALESYDESATSHSSQTSPSSEISEVCEISKEGITKGDALSLPDTDDEGEVF